MMQIDSLPRVYEERNAFFALEKMRLMKQTVATICTKQKKIIGYTTEEDLLSYPFHTHLKSIAHHTTFFSELSNAADALSRMRQEHVLFSFVINQKGDITGVLSLYTLLEEFIPQIAVTKAPTLHISKTIPAEMKIGDFCMKYDLSLTHSSDDTFLDIMETMLDHKPKVGEKILIGSLEVTVKETSLLGPKTLFVQSL